MKAAYYDRQGPAADVLVIGDVPLPSPGPGEVRVRVFVSGLNPSDIKARTGFLEPMHFDRVIPHQDGAGLIDSVGDGVSPDRIGERVWIYEAQSGNPHGTAAEFVIVPADQAVKLPNGTTFDVGASIGIPAMTAHRCLFADGDLRGRRVLVHGGGGVVGEAAIMLAKWAGAWVATTIRDASDEDRVRSKGADLVINMLKEDVPTVLKAATDGHGVDRIVEVNLVPNLEIDLACLAPTGVISTYALTAADDVAPVPVFRAMVGGFVFRFVFIYTVPKEAKQHAITDITACLTANQYHPTVGFTAPLNRIAEAHETLEKREIPGKILIDIQSDF